MTVALCRDCGARLPPARAESGHRCPECGRPRLLRHPELDALSIAHIDCDAFYASVEKRDDPSLDTKPVIVGGSHRGVVAAACYVARIYGVRSAMPMFEALKRCPDAVVIPPNMAKYQTEGRRIRALMGEATPLVEPLSIDEAFLDLSGTEQLHGASPAITLIRLIGRIEREVGVTASVGLSYNKFLAKIASDLDKPRGFTVIGRAEALEFLAPKPVRLLWGVGAALQRRLVGDGISTIGQLRQRDEADLIARYGAIGRRLARFARGEDDRRVDPDAPTKSVSAETTFDRDVGDPNELRGRLWRLTEKVSERLKRAGLGGRTVTLKLRTGDFRTLTRSRTLAHPTQLADILYRAAQPLLDKEADGTEFRLIGIGASGLVPGAEADPPDLLDPSSARRARVEHAVDTVRKKAGGASIAKGRGPRGRT